MNDERHGRFTPAGTWFAEDGPPGAQPAVVLAHGVGLDHRMWDAQASALAAHARVVRPDMLGHGATPALARRASLADFRDRLVELLDHLAIERAMLVGFSMGGIIAQSLAARHADRLAGLVLMSTVYRRTEAESDGVRARLALTEAQGPAGIVESAIERWFPEAFRAANPAAVEAVRERLATNDRRGYEDAYRVFAECDAEIGPALRAVTCPALVVTGTDDPGSTPEIAARMVADLPHARLVLLERLRHMVTVEAPERVNALLLSFLEEVRAAADG